MEEEKNGAFMISNNDCWGCRHNRPSQTEHACCNYGFVISEDEEEEEGEIKEEEEGEMKEEEEEVKERRITQALEVMRPGIVEEERLRASIRLNDFQGMLKEIIQTWRKEEDGLTRHASKNFIFYRKLMTCWYVYLRMCERHCKEIVRVALHKTFVTLMP